MEYQLEKIFEFLKSNRQYNLELQAQFFRPVLCVSNSVNPKVINLLYHVANTQSQPKMDPLSDFYRLVYGNIQSTNSFGDFVYLLTGQRSVLFNDLYKGLTQKKGWGDKTAALFTKVVYQAHNSLGSEFEFWQDTPKSIGLNDEIWLPVDAVIIHIFKELGMKSPSFNNINKLLKKYYSGDDLEVWDDLWFWGFITQKGTGDSRTIEWNVNKYWSLTHSDKKSEVINQIEHKAIHFISLLQQKI